ncbi:MAG: hypothetical protein Q8O39_01650 [bacterium]|nr:hypothetical protein [bacterium]
MKNKIFLIIVVLALFLCGTINAETATSVQTTTGNATGSTQNIPIENIKTITPQATSVQKINALDTQKAIESIIKPFAPIIQPVEKLLQTTTTAEPQKIEAQKQEIPSATSGTGGGASVSVSSVSTTTGKCEIVNKERTRELNNLLVELQKANKVGQQELVVRIKEKINSINQEIEKAKKECANQITTRYPQSTTSTQIVIAQPTPQKPVGAGNPTEIADYYKDKMTNILQKTGDTDQTINSLKQLRNEIDQMIVKLVRETEKIKMSDIKDLTQELTISPSQIQVNNIKMDIENQKEIGIESKGKEINIKANLQNIQIQDGGFNVKSMERIMIKNQEMNIAEQKITVLPTEATSLFKLKPEEIKEFNLDVENNKPVYNIKTIEARKLFGIIPVSISREAKIDAVSVSSEKNILEDNKPWWTFLTSK